MTAASLVSVLRSSYVCVCENDLLGVWFGWICQNVIVGFQDFFVFFGLLIAKGKGGTPPPKGKAGINILYFHKLSKILKSEIRESAFFRCFRLLIGFLLPSIESQSTDSLSVSVYYCLKYIMSTTKTTHTYTATHTATHTHTQPHTHTHSHTYIHNTHNKHVSYIDAKELSGMTANLSTHLEAATSCKVEPLFHPYPKVPNTLGKLKKKLTAHDTWVVTEKVHGANFCCVVAGPSHHQKIQYARRKAFLGPRERFFGFRHQGIPARYESVLLQVANAARKHISAPEGARVYVYCELFGGIYPHPNVGSVVGAQPVQYGVSYSPGLELIAFDLAIEINPELGVVQPDMESSRPVTETEPGPEPTLSQSADAIDAPPLIYLDYTVACEIFEGAGLLYAKPLLIGSLASCLDFNERFDSKIPEQLGLPPLPAHSNLAEGVVIKPVCAAMYAHRNNKVKRVIIKKKIAEFSERSTTERAVHGSRRGLKTAARVSHCREGAISDAVGRAVFAELRSLVTHARLDNLVSKIGRPGAPRHAGEAATRIAAATLKEALLVDIWDEGLAEWLDVQQQRWALAEKPALMHTLQAPCKALIHDYFVELDRRDAAAEAGKNTTERQKFQE